MKPTILILTLLVTSAHAQGTLDHGVQPQVYRTLTALKQNAPLGDDEFKSMLASAQQFEIAASVQRPMPAQLDTFARVQLLNSRCLFQIRPKLKGVQALMINGPLDLDVPERKQNFLKFTGQLPMRTVEADIAGVLPQEACAKAAQYVKP